MDKLQTCAMAFRKLLDYEYRCIVGKKGKTQEFVLAFRKQDFHHLAGLHKLEDIEEVRGNRERIFKDIVDGRITDETVDKSVYLHAMRNRIFYLTELENFMDSNNIIFTYDKMKNPMSKIEAAFLLENDIYATTVYFFIDQDTDSHKMIGRSFFAKEKMDYTINQSRMTLLFKEKINTITKKSIVQLDKLTPIKEKLSEAKQKLAQRVDINKPTRAKTNEFER